MRNIVIADYLKKKRRWTYKCYAQIKAKKNFPIFRQEKNFYMLIKKSFTLKNLIASMTYKLVPKNEAS